MSVLFCFYFLFWYYWPVVVGEELTPPQDVKVTTLNTNYTLIWDWPQSPAESHVVTFTTEYVGKYKLQYKKRSPKWSTVCNETLRKSCDLTGVGLHYLGIYMLRVRANIMGLHSNWVQQEFSPDKDAALGPPTKVNLVLDKSNLEISISEPMTSKNITMRSCIPTLYYHIVYWERSANSQSQMLTSDTTLVYLSDLKAWTWYCVSAQSRYDFYNKSSIFTPTQCIQTEGSVPWWQIILYFLGSLLTCFLLMLLSFWTSFWCYRTIKATFFPSDQLPLHLKRYICGPAGCDVPSLFTPDPESVLLCERSIIPTDLKNLQIFSPTLECLVVTPSGPELDRISCQNTSGDSGVFCTGGSSNVQQSSSSQVCTGVEGPWWGPFDLEKVKIAPGFIGQPINETESIVDIFVKGE